MDPALKEMLSTTVSIRRPSTLSKTGSENAASLGAAVPIAAYVERRFVNMPSADGKGMQRVVRHFIVTEEEIREGDRVWLAGMDTSDMELSKRADEVAVFLEPFTAVVDHYEVML